MTPEGPFLPAAPEVAVVFLFPGSSEVRYLSKPPAPGARVRNSTGEQFIVARVRAGGGERLFTAHCVVPAVGPTRSATRRHAGETPEDESGQPGAIDDLANHLHGLVRRTIEAPGRLRRRYRMRHYIP